MEKSRGKRWKNSTRRRILQDPGLNRENTNQSTPTYSAAENCDRGKALAARRSAGNIAEGKKHREASLGSTEKTKTKPERPRPQCQDGYLTANGA